MYQVGKGLAIPFGVEDKGSLSGEGNIYDLPGLTRMHHMKVVAEH